MNMLKEHRRNPSRRRQTPKRFEDEKFMSGRYDQYTRGYDGWQPKKSYGAQRENAENYYQTNNGRKFATVTWINSRRYRVNLRDFPESLLEIASIWRDLDMVLPSAIVEKIGEFLNFDSSSKQVGMLTQDDEFVAADDSEEDEIEESEEEEFESCSDTDEEDYDSDYSSYSDDD